jgi:hypothetical protein
LGDTETDGRILKWIWEEIGCEGVDFIQLAQDMVQGQAVVNMAMNLKESIKGREISDQVSDHQLLKKATVRCS